MRMSILNLFHWLPRIICILAILFVSIFALDAFAPGLTIWHQLGAFLIHLIPSYTLIAFLVIAWKWELVGGIIFTILGVGLSPFIFMLNQSRNQFSIGTSFGIILMITFPFILTGVLFIISHMLKKKERQINKVNK